jgi:D-glycero-alpha-D-manno-heptose-7-phosphate kinase
VIIEARAPTRVDLAGGTLDIHPIYLLEDEALTINAAVEIPVHVRLAPARQGVIVTSRDLRDRIRAPSAEALPLGGPLDLVCRALRASAPRPGLAVTLSSAAPAGSGLGASSALLVSLLAALDRRERRRRSVTDLVLAAWRLEAQSLRTLTGRQDYLAAVHGGINAMRFGIAGDAVEPLRGAPLRRALQERLVIAYTGRPHASGLTNWGVVRAYLDGAPSTVNHLRCIAEIARAMRRALERCDLDAVAGLITDEWTHRRELAAGVTTPVVERALAIARRHGALAGKACGAGGGGCVLFVVRAGAKRYCEDALRTAGFAVLPSRLARAGLRVRVMPAASGIRTRS